MSSEAKNYQSVTQEALATIKTSEVDPRVSEVQKAISEKIAKLTVGELAIHFGEINDTTAEMISLTQEFPALLAQINAILESHFSKLDNLVARAKAIGAQDLVVQSTEYSQDLRNVGDIIANLPGVSDFNSRVLEHYDVQGYLQLRDWFMEREVDGSSASALANAHLTAVRLWMMTDDEILAVQGVGKGSLKKWKILRKKLEGQEQEVDEETAEAKLLSQEVFEKLPLDEEFGKGGMSLSQWYKERGMSNRFANRLARHDLTPRKLWKMSDVQISDYYQIGDAVLGAWHKVKASLLQA